VGMILGDIELRSPRKNGGSCWVGGSGVHSSPDSDQHETSPASMIFDMVLTLRWEALLESDG